MTALLPEFAHWSQPWARLGLWLSLWDHEARPVIGTPQPGAFWQLLREHSGRFQQLLRQMARRALTSQATCVELEPCGAIHVICLPVVSRSRTIGSVLGCAVAPEFREDENLARFCSLHELDRHVCAHLAFEVQHYSPESLTSFTEILHNQMEALSGHALAVRDVHDLSRRLAQSYEELNLIYRVSSNLTVLKRPSAHLDEVCRDLLDVTVVDSFAALLERPGGAGEPELVCAGPVPAPSDQLIRLYRQVSGHGLNAGAALVVNNVEGEPDYEWSTRWLRQFVYFPLDRQGRNYGGLLALNHVDAVDFGSEEIQLIGAVIERSAAYIENVRLYEDLEHLFMGMLHALVSSIDAKDPYTRGHSQRVAWLSRHLAELLDLDEDQCRRVYLSGLLHDVGKIGVPESVLRKTGRLSEEEFAEMKRHPEIGARILQAVRQIEDVIPGVLEHHERYDGLGYPHGLAGERISMMGRIIALADSFDAMTSSRTYRTAHPLPIAIAELRRWSGTQFDPRLVDQLLREDLARLLRVMSDSEKQPLVRDAGLAPRLRGEAVA